MADPAPPPEAEPGRPWRPADPRPRLLTVGALESLLAAEIDPPEIDELERRLLLFDLAGPLAAHLWPDLAPRPADLKILADDLGDGFDRLKLAGLSWAQVAALPPAPLGSLLADLGRRQDELLAARGRLDRFSRRRLVLEALSDGQPFRALAGVDLIKCAWFQRLSPFETEFLLALAHGRRLELTLKVPAWVRDEAIVHSAGFDLLRSIRRIENCEEPTLWLDFAEYSQETPAPALAYAADRLLAPVGYHTDNPPDIGDQLVIIRTPTAYHEVEDAARRLKTRLTQGVAPGALALVVPDPVIYEPLIDDMGRRFGLAFHFRRGTPLLDQGPVRAVMKLLALWTSEWERSRLMDLIRSPYFNFPVDPVLAHRISLEAGVTDRRAGGGFEENLTKRLTRRLDERERPTAEALAEGIRRLDEQGRTLSAAPDWPEFIRRFKAILNDHQWPGDLGLAPESPVNVRGADQAAAGAFLEELDHLERALTQTPAPPRVGLDIFSLWLETVLAERRLSFDPDPDGRVRVLNYYDLHGGCFDEIFFLGLNERVFPNTGTDTRWWPEEFTRAAADRDLLGRPLWNEAADRYRQEELMLAAGLGQARAKVWLYYHAGDESGRVSLPSPLLTVLKELWPDGQGGSLLPEKSLGWRVAPPLNQVAGPDELSAALMKTPPEKWPEAYARDPGLQAFHQAVLTRAESWRALRNEAKPGPAAVDRWLSRRSGFGHQPLIRPNFLGAMADCPLAFWLGEALALGGEDQEVEEWSATSEGTLIHAVLERFFARRLGRPWPGAEDYKTARAELLTLLDEEVKKLAARHPLGRRPLWEIRRERLPEILSGWLRWEMASESVRPWKLEWSFDQTKRADAGPWKLDLDGGETLYFKGRVDRLDQTEEGLAVRDYKLRHRDEFRLKNGGKSIQTTLWPLLVYTLATAETFGQPAQGWFEIIDPTAKEARIAALDSRQPEMSTRHDPGEEESGRANFPSLLRQTWAELRAGIFPPRVGEDRACAYCQYTLICPRADRDEAGSE